MNAVLFFGKARKWYDDDGDGDDDDENNKFH